MKTESLLHTLFQTLTPQAKFTILESQNTTSISEIEKNCAAGTIFLWKVLGNEKMAHPSPKNRPSLLHTPGHSSPGLLDSVFWIIWILPDIEPSNNPNNP